MDRQDWLAERQKGIGGSDAASVMGLSSMKIEKVGLDGKVYQFRPYSKIPTPLKLWLEKTGREPHHNDESLYTLKGHAMEPLLLKMYEEMMGLKLLPKPDIIYHKEHHWMLASLDGWTDECVVDAKTSSKPDIWGENGSDQVPLNIACQMQWYMMVTGLNRADVIAWLECGRYMDVRIYHIYEDEAFQKELFEKGQKFWKHVEEDTPPEPADVCDIEYLFPKMEPLSRIEVTPDICSMVTELSMLRTRRLATVKECEEREESLKYQILNYSQDKEQLVFNNRVIATVSTSRSGKKTISPKGF